ncbi:MAG: 4-hydroxy-tetrahydrodipicolinate reductase, partial [Alphaproteobacteria bacterium]|nr:4-hydroxy-tetrahydrodipicolinate reductase [Alphaproteobacteria bacterium]
AGGSERQDSPFIGLDIGLLAGTDAAGVKVLADSRALFMVSDVIIDFTAATATAATAALAAETGKALVGGTTGLGPEPMSALGAAARRVPVVHAPNMSLGVNLLFALVEEVARTLDDSYDIEIVEMHHRHKVDAPSGTALGLGRAAALGRMVDLDAVSERVRDGHTGARRTGAIGFATLRGGDVVGDHTVIFAADGERIELTHKASSRTVFAKGAVRAARWACSQPPGLYSMRDVLGLS